MLPILCSGITTETNMDLIVLNYLPLTLADFPSQALFARRLMLRVKMFDEKDFSYGSFIVPSSVAFVPRL